MALWWIGNAVLLLVVVPVVVGLLQAVVKPATEIQETAGALAAAGGVLLEDLEAVEQLATTADLVHATTAGLARYGAALDRIL